MSWLSFGTKTKQETPVTGNPNAPIAVQKSKKAQWVATVAEDVFEQTIENMFQEVTEMKGFPNKHDENNVIVFAKGFLSKIPKVARNRLTVKQQEVLGTLIFDSFPSAVAKMETQLMDIDDRDYAVEEFGEYLRQLMGLHLDTMPRKVPIPNMLESVTPEMANKAVETVGTKEADEKLAAVKTLAAETYKLAKTVEEQFFAEQAANSYIPDSVRMLAGLMHAPDDMKQEANELFMKQLGIIETQLNNIVRRAAGSSLDALRAHTEFLESKDETGKVRMELK